MFKNTSSKPAFGDFKRVLPQAGHITKDTKKQDADSHLLSY